jgi:hypothetical protein
MKIGYVCATAVLALASAIASADVLVDNSLSAGAFLGRNSEVKLYGTIAPKGSFEERVAPHYTKLAEYRDSLADRVLAGKISVAIAQAGQARADQVRELLDDSFRACAQDNHTGKCTGDEAKAKAYLKKALSKLSKLR